MMLFSVSQLNYGRAERRSPELLRYRDKIVDTLRRLVEDDTSPKLVNPQNGDSVEFWSRPIGLLNTLFNLESRRVVLECESNRTRSWFRFPEDTVLATIAAERIDGPRMSDEERRRNEQLASIGELHELHLALTTWVRQPKRRPVRRS